jgi:hypothetical protein
MRMRIEGRHQLAIGKRIAEVSITEGSSFTVSGSEEEICIALDDGHELVIYQTDEGTIVLDID